MLIGVTLPGRMFSLISNPRQLKHQFEFPSAANKHLSFELAGSAGQYSYSTSIPFVVIPSSAIPGGFGTWAMASSLIAVGGRLPSRTLTASADHRMFGTEVAEKVTKVRIAQALARDKHLSTTQRYIDINDNKLRAAIELLK